MLPTLVRLPLIGPNSLFPEVGRSPVIKACGPGGVAEIAFTPLLFESVTVPSMLKHDALETSQFGTGVCARAIPGTATQRTANAAVCPSQLKVGFGLPIQPLTTGTRAPLEIKLRRGRVLRMG